MKNNNGVQVLTVSQNDTVRVFNSIRAASRMLSGTGSEELRSTIARRVAEGGGYVGNVYVTSGIGFSRA